MDNNNFSNNNPIQNGSNNNMANPYGSYQYGGNRPGADSVPNQVTNSVTNPVPNQVSINTQNPVNGFNPHNLGNDQSIYRGSYSANAGSGPNMNPNMNSGMNNNAGSNRYSSNAYSSNTYGNQTPPVNNDKTKKKKEKNGNGTFKKLAVSLGAGLIFGTFAAVSFFAVKEIAGVIGIDKQEQASVATVDSAPVYLEGKATDEDGNSTAESSISTVNTQHMSTSVVTDVSDVVAETMPSIVKITNNYTYNNFYYSMPVEGRGSGIIIGNNDNELLIVTNYHVIESNETLQVTFADDTTAEATVKGTDSSMDLAVIAVDYDDIDAETQSKIKIATMGDSEALKVGEPAIAIGNALGYGTSVTLGVISATDREMDMDGNGTTRTFIQTDAAINEGNSGGALLNIAGEVVGINSNKLGGSSVEGMGYAIPISAAQPIIEQLMTKETRKIVDDSERAYLGISGATVTSAEASFYGYPEGVYISSVYDGSAADAAGISKGDLITSFDGESVTSMEQLQRLLKYYKTGETVEVGVYKYTMKGYELNTIQVTLGSREDIDG